MPAGKGVNEVFFADTVRSERGEGDKCDPKLCD